MTNREVIFISAEKGHWLAARNWEEINVPEEDHDFAQLILKALTTYSNDEISLNEAYAIIVEAVNKKLDGPKDAILP
jgi:hypothetical protein